MKHLSRITVAKATTSGESDVQGILSEIFAFVLDVIDVKGKGSQTAAS